MLLLEQFIRFTTDIVGLERLLRLVQALLIVSTSYAWLLDLAVTAISAAASPEKRAQDVIHYSRVLRGTRDQINIVRRFFRAFRFLECFYKASQLFMELLLPQEQSAEEKSGEKSGTTSEQKKKPTDRQLSRWLDAFSAAFFGMHLMLEVQTLPDVMGVDGLVLWGPEATAGLTTQALRFWFLALACSAAASGLRLLRVTKDVEMEQPPLPALEKGGEGDPDLLKSALVDADADADSDTEGGQDEKKLAKLAQEQERLRRIMRLRLDQRRLWRKRVRVRAAALARRALADGLDLVIPGSSLGWIPVQTGTVGLTMVTTTLLTGWEAWIRCGQPSK